MLKLNELIKQSDQQRKLIQETQKDIASISGEKDDSDLTVNTYGFQYFIFISLITPNLVREISKKLRNSRF